MTTLTLSELCRKRMRMEMVAMATARMVTARKGIATAMMVVMMVEMLRVRARMKVKVKQLVSMLDEI